MRVIVLFLVGVLLAANAKAETVGAPHGTVNDTWTFQTTIEDKTGWHQTRNETVVERVGPTTIALSTKQAGSTMPPNERLTGA